jgi:hypothetical protein
VVALVGALLLAPAASAMIVEVGARSDESSLPDTLRVVSLQNGIALAAPGDTLHVVGNGGSTYIDDTFIIDKDLLIEGGWRADFRVRDPDIYVTAVRDTLRQFNKALIEVLGAPRVELDGIHIIGGQTGIRAEGGATVIVRDCVIRSQRNSQPGTALGPPGGGIRMVGGSLLVEGGRIHNIQSWVSGGAVALEGNAVAELRGVQIDNAVLRGSADGAAVWASGAADVRISDSRLESCGSGFQGPGRGGLLYVIDSPLLVERTLLARSSSPRGGAVYLDGAVGSRFVDCDFELNGATGTLGAGIAAVGAGSLQLEGCRFTRNGTDESGAALRFEQTTFEIVGCEFDDNTLVGATALPERGGSGFSIESFGTFTNCTFRNEKTSGRGGVWSALGGEVTFDGCRFENNRTGIFGGVLQIELGGRIIARNSLFVGNDAKFGGAVAASFTGEIDLEHVTITQGSATTSGAGVYVDTGGTVRIDDSIICCATRGDLVACSSGSVVVSYSDVWNDPAANARAEFTGSCPDPTGTNGVLKADPAFCPADPDYGLQPGSPAVGSAGDGGDMGWIGVGCSVPLSLEKRSWGRIKAGYRGGSR